jgi:hypothetical protein
MQKPCSASSTTRIELASARALGNCADIGSGARLAMLVERDPAAEALVSVDDVVPLLTSVVTQVAVEGVGGLDKHLVVRVQMDGLCAAADPADDEQNRDWRE